MDALIKAICDDEDLVVIHREDDGTLVCVHAPTRIATKVSPEVFNRVSIDDVMEILRVEREPEVLVHMTRVVGYYSRVDNWNLSKRGELSDRHKGNYVVSEA